MPVRCVQCGEEALTETARFCVGCGAALPALPPGVIITEMTGEHASVIAEEGVRPEPPGAESETPVPDSAADASAPATTVPEVLEPEIGRRASSEAVPQRMQEPVPRVPDPPRELPIDHPSFAPRPTPRRDPPAAAPSAPASGRQPSGHAAPSLPSAQPRVTRAASDPDPLVPMPLVLLAIAGLLALLLVLLLAS